jgi:hypothetical protein
MPYDIPPNRRLGADAIIKAGLSAPGYRPQKRFYPPDYPVSRLLDPPAPTAFGYGGGSPTQQASNIEPPPAYAPGGGEVAPPAYEPGGGETPYDPLTSISTGRPYGAAGYAMPAWTPPTPPPRPANLGQVLSRATVPAAASRAQGRAQQAPQPLTANDLFGTVQLNPNQRNAPIYTALNVGSLFGWGGGGGGAQPAAAPAAQPSAPVGRTSLRPPSNDDWTFDENGNPIMTTPNTNLTTSELSQAVNKPGWYRRLG